MKGKDSKPHLGIFGRRNHGKSSLINILAGQDVAIVSDIAGTTTDPVKKSIEIGGIGPVVMIDTAGIDDTGELGRKRVARTEEMLKVIDLAILVIAGNQWGDEEQNLIRGFRDQNLPFFIIHNRADEEPLDAVLAEKLTQRWQVPVIDFSCKDHRDHQPLIDAIRECMPETAYRLPGLVSDLVAHGQVVLLITPIDIEAPEGRLILPQVQVIRDVLDNDCIAVVCKEREVDVFIRRMNLRPDLAITDSQAFLKADAAVPRDIPLTSFSILLARQKGEFEAYLQGTPAISTLKDGDRVLILESCTHHVSCDDIGRVKIPRWLVNFTGKKLEFDVIAGLGSLPEQISAYALVVQCGGCVLTRRQISGRIRPFIDAGVPVTNYGLAIAYVHGVFDRAVEPLKLRTRGKGYL